MELSSYDQRVLRWTPRQDAHAMKMGQKKVARKASSDKRTAAYEHMKGDAQRVVLKMRTWLKSPYAFRRGGQ